MSYYDEEYKKLFEEWNLISCLVPETKNHWLGFETVFLRYSDLFRVYHSPKHLVNCFDILSKLFPNEKLDPAIRLALFFHDAVYNTTATDNEAQSCALLDKLLPDVDESIRNDAKSYIMVTSSHQPFNEQSKIVIDCDLAILGSLPEEYEAYEAAIREEYYFVPQDLYVSGRAKVMSKFANKEFVFSTEQMINSEYETNAKINLARYKESS
jgi:predicted metal-dependent HD superfamily phosphohydrolase